MIFVTKCKDNVKHFHSHSGQLALTVLTFHILLTEFRYGKMIHAQKIRNQKEGVGFAI